MNGEAFLSIKTNFDVNTIDLDNSASDWLCTEHFLSFWKDVVYVNNQKQVCKDAEWMSNQFIYFRVRLF